ncbi:MAG: type II toxin-antitoxin system RelE/ParE family toxin [Proteobacteria bacterium]|nr:type II toxin-antitoxin system RelE/ParE family toxin [Pseudomonadota bacterium]
MSEDKRLPARFFASGTGRVPVREWLLSLSSEDRKTIGDDIRTAEFGWPVGMPLCCSIKDQKGLWEIRSSLSNGRIARVFFCVHDGSMVLLHGFMKKTQKTPDRELDVAKKRMRGLT